MPNPKKKHTRSRRDMRRSQNSKLEIKELRPCPNCGELGQPHRVCKSCGYYDGKLEVAVKSASDEAEEQK